MRITKRYTLSFIAALAACDPLGSAAADLPSTTSPIVVSAGAANSVRVSGTVSGAHQLQAILYATFGPELPTVLLGRRPITSDADGHFDETYSLAPAYFSGAVVTVIVQSAGGVTLGRSSVTIVTPSATASPRI